MSLNAGISSKIAPLLKGPNNDTIFNAISAALQNNQITPAELLTEAKLISAEVLHRLGEFLQNSANSEHRKIAALIYFTAGEKGNAWSFAYCAMLHLNKNQYYGLDYLPQGAIKLANLALDKCKGQPNNILLKLVLARALKANGNLLEANQAAIEYLNFCLSCNSKTFNQQNTNEGIKFCRETIADVLKDFNTGNNQLPPREVIDKRLQELAPFFSGDVFKSHHPTNEPELNLLRQEVWFLQTVYYQMLGRNEEAMKLHCLINSTCPHYKIALSNRAVLLKDTVTQVLVPVPVQGNTAAATALVAQGAIPVVTTSSSVTTSISPSLITTPLIIKQQTRFSRFWQRVSPHFDVVNETSLKEEYERRIAQLQVLIRAKEVEIELVQESIQAAEKSNDSTLPSLRLHGEKLKSELKALTVSETSLRDMDYKTHTAVHRQQYRRAVAEASFFDPKRSKKKDQISSLAYKIIDSRYQQTTDSIELSKYSVRLHAHAEKAIQNAILILAGTTRPQLGLPYVREKVLGSSILGYGPREVYKIGDTDAVFEHRTHPDSERLGDSYSPDYIGGTYNASIYPFLLDLAQGNPEKEKQIAQLFIVYGKKQQSVTLEALQAIKSDVTQKDVEQFNRVCILILAKEQTQWLSANKSNYKGLTVSQARCILLMTEGLLRFEDAFKNDGVFSIYSNRGLLYNPNTLAQACQRVDDLFIQFLQIKHPLEHSNVMKQAIASRQKLTIIATRKQARADLKAVYGGDSDSDNEADYNSDLEPEGSFLGCRP